MKQTLAIIKPDAVRRGLAYRILKDGIADLGLLQIDALEMVRLTEATAMVLYEEHRGRPYFDRLIDFTVSGPLIIMALSATVSGASPKGAVDPIEYWRTQVKCIRYNLLAENYPGPDNLVHGSDSTLAAVRELALFWPYEGAWGQSLHKPCSPRQL
jgi:nucleoside-diphosphate kinase